MKINHKNDGKISKWFRFLSRRLSKDMVYEVNNLLEHH